MKRFLSILLACMMLLSMVTISHAADAVTVTYWNADSTKITIDLSAEVDADALKNAITLTQNGAPVEVAVAKKTKTVNSTIDDYVEDKYEVAGMDVTTSTTYEIKPANGLNFTDLYELTIGAEITGTTAFTKLFKVKKLWIENFDSYTAGDASTIPWKIEGAANLAKFDVEDDGNGDKALVWTHKGGTYRVMMNKDSAAEFADTGVAASTYWADGSAARMETEYNIEVDLRYASSATDAKYAKGFAIAMQNLKHNQVLYGGSGIAAGFLVANEKSFGVVAGTWGHGNYKNATTGSFQTNYKRSEVKSDWHAQFDNGAPYTEDVVGWTNSPIKKSNLSDGDWTNDTVHKVSMSVKENNLKYSLEDVFVNYGFDAHAGKTQKRFGAFAFYGTGNYGVESTYFVDNIVVTKAEEVVVGTLEAPTNFVAGSEGIQFKLAKDMDAASLKNGISLLADGTPVADFAVAKAEGADYTYAIAPVGGVDVDATYTVTLAAGLYNETAGGVSALAAPFSTEVGIEKIPFNAPTYWNADTTKITLDIDAPIDAAALKNGITLYKGTEAVEDFTVAALTNFATLADVYTYTVAPAEGIVEGPVYTIGLKAGTYNSDGFYYSLASDYSKSFTLDVLVRDTMDYLDPEVEGNGKLPWKASDTDGTVSLDVDEVTGNKSLKVVTTAATMVSPCYGNTYGGDEAGSQTFADTGVTGHVYSYSKTPAAAKEEDYTLELKVKSTATGSYKFVVYGGAHRASTTPGGSYNSMCAGVTSSNKFYGSIYKGSAGRQGEFTGTTGSATLSTTGFTSIAVSTKGTDYKAWVGDAFAHKINADSIVDCGIPLFDLSGANTYLIDDVIMSKAIEVTSGRVYGDLVVTANDEKINTLAGAATIDAVINVMNLDEVLDCKVVLAIYNSKNNALKNAVVSNNNQIAQGITSFEFNDVAVNSGDVLAVYFWNGFETLTPYRAPVTFPEAE